MEGEKGAPPQPVFITVLLPFSRKRDSPSPDASPGYDAVLGTAFAPTRRPQSSEFQGGNDAISYDPHAPRRARGGCRNGLAERERAISRRAIVPRTIDELSIVPHALVQYAMRGRVEVLARGDSRQHRRSEDG